MSGPELARATCCAFRGADAWCDVGATRAWAAGLDCAAIGTFARSYAAGGLATNTFPELAFTGVEVCVCVRVCVMCCVCAVLCVRVFLFANVGVPRLVRTCVSSYEYAPKCACVCL